MDIIVPITGRRASGKDTIARIGIEKFGCTGSVALSDWFKRLLAAHFKLPLEDFYSAKKDQDLERPLVIRRGDISRLLSSTSQMASKFVDVRYQKVSVMKWEGREIKSLRELMVWWANDVISENLGEELHNVITAQALDPKTQPVRIRRKAKRGEFDLIFITDARQYKQSAWFKTHGFEHVYPIKVVRPLGSFDQTAPEKAVDEFPEGYFFETIINDESLEVLEQKVVAVLGRIRADMRRKVRPAPNETQEPLQPTQKET